MENKDATRRLSVPAIEPTVINVNPGSIPGTPADKTVPVPSIGRMVHYYAYGTPGGEYEPGAVRAATVVGVLGEPNDPYPNLNLFVMTPQGSFHNTAAYGPGKAGCWGWPVYVPPVALPE